MLAYRGLLVAAAPGIGGMRSSHAVGGAGAIAKSRKARFPALRAGKAPKFFRYRINLGHKSFLKKLKNLRASFNQNGFFGVINSV
jgi:hypothetical protein